MSESNPYAAPETAQTLAPGKGLAFAELNDKALKKLYYRSCNLSCIAFLLGLGLLVMIWVLTTATSQSLSSGGPLSGMPFFAAIAVFYLVAMLGLILRNTWGRILGIIVCLFSLLSIPIGTIIGVAGLFALFGAPQLFGPDRVLHKDLKIEFKLRKKLKKEAKRAAKAA